MSPGDRVFLGYGNRIDFFMDLLAIWSLGASAIPLDSHITRFELGNLTATATPRFFMHDDKLDAGFRALLDEQEITLIDTTPGAGLTIDASPSNSGAVLDRLNSATGEALILFTSGSTDQPKGVVHTHESLRAKWQSLAAEFDSRTFRRTLCMLPTHFGHGLICNALFPWLTGHELFLLPSFSTQSVMSLGEVLTRHEITFLSSVPAIWQLALKTPRPRKPKLIEVFCGSAPLSISLWNQITDWCGGGAVRNVYGITETGSWIAGSRKGAEPMDGLVGGGWGTSFRITEGSGPDHAPDNGVSYPRGTVGHIWANTSALMEGYLDRQDLTDQVVSQGWFSTGDIGKIDAEGQLILKGRERDEINRGGMKVYPADIEAAVSSFPAVLDCCSFACSDPHYGQSVGVALVMEKSDQATLRAVYRWTIDRLADHKIPTFWYMLDEIPKTNRGKVKRNELAEHCAGLIPVDMARILGQAT